MTAAPGSVVVVSPHYDDAVLSTYARLASGSVSTVINVFTAAPPGCPASAWDRRCGFADAAEAQAARSAEDRAALSGLSLQSVEVGLIDLAYLPNGRRLDDDRARLLEFLEALLATAPPETVLALPIGAGRSRRRLLRQLALRLRLPVRMFREMAPHPDHQFVRDVGVEVARARGGRVVLYEDSPYAIGHPADSVAAELARREGAALALVIDEADIESKARAVSCYRSQLSALFPAWVRRDLAGTLPRAERSWWLDFSSADEANHITHRRESSRPRSGS